MEINPKLLPNSLITSFTTILYYTLMIQTLAFDDNQSSFNACEPKSCGTGLNISYPFWLKGEHPPYCGHPSLGLTCTRNPRTNISAPVLKIYLFEYFISDIFYDNQSFIIVNTYFFQDPCPLPIVSLTDDTNKLILDYPFTISKSNNIVYFLINCSRSLQGFEKVSCTGKLDYFGGLYKNTSEKDVAAVGKCQIVKVPVVQYPNTTNNRSNYFGVLRGGGLLNWVLPDCSECKKSGGRCGYDNSNMTCICPDQVGQHICAPKQIRRHKVSEKRREIALSLVATSVACLLILAYILYKRKRTNVMRAINTNSPQRKNAQNIDTFLDNYKYAAPKRYTYKEIKKMTNSLSNKLGQGGYGTVFLGTLQDGHSIAVKVLNQEQDNNRNEDFINEVASISQTSHVNVVSLLGYCSEGPKRALIYDYMPNGSLEKFIYTSKCKAQSPLGWKNLYKIAIGIARGLEYLHRGCNTRIVHFDIKPHNILLDDDFNPKIADFGLAKLCLQKGSVISTVAARGTIGYIAPEVFYRTFGAVSTKSDVYSYGMMVLEMVGGRKNFDAAAEHSCETYFPHWIYDNLELFIDTAGDILNRSDDNEEEMVRKMIVVSLWCIQTAPVDRPSMSMVVDMLEGKIIDVPMPPRP